MRKQIAALLLVTLTPQLAWAGKREPKPEPEPPEVGELSEQGTRRGGVEIGLGVLLGGTAVGLIAFGTVQLIRAREHVAFCNQEVTVIDETDESGGIDPCVFDPPALGFASAGLSWGFSIPLLVGSGLLFARAHRVRADAREYDRLQRTLGSLTVAPWWQRDGGGATLVLRF